MIVPASANIVNTIAIGSHNGHVIIHQLQSTVSVNLSIKNSKNQKELPPNNRMFVFLSVMSIDIIHQG